MTTWFTRASVGAFALAVLSLASCKKDETQVVLKTAAAPALTVSTTTPDLVLTTANANTTGETFTYTAADFGYQSVTSYAVQVDKKGGDFSNPQTFPGGSTAGAVTLSKSQLANAFFALGYAYGANAQVDTRVVASVSANAPTQVSPVVTLTATPTPVCIPDASGRSWSIIGPAGDGWSADRTMTYDCYSQNYILKTTLNAGDFKFRVNKDWTVNLGGTGTLSAGAPLTLNGANLTIATAGTYTVTLSITTDGSGNVTGGTAVVK